MMGSIFSCWKVTSTTSFVNCLLVSFAINLLCLIDDLCIRLLFSHSVVSDSLQLHGLQHSRLPCPSSSPGACSNSCPSSQWCHPTISSLCWPLLLLPSIFPSIRVFSSEPAVHIRWPKAQNVVFAECLYRASQKSLLWGREPGWLLLLISHCHVWLCDPRACQAPLSSTISWSWRKFVSIESMILSNHLILCFPVFLFPSIFPNFRVFSSESVLCISIGASATVLPMSIRGLFPFELTVVISLQSKRLWRVFSSTTIQKCQFFSTLPSL